MNKIRIGVQGMRGAYHEIAAESYINEVGIKSFELVNCDVFETIFQKLHDNELDLGVLAFENSLAGSIYKNFDLLNQFNFKIIGEAYVHVQHQLLGTKNSRLSDITEVHSQWPALEQVRHNLKVLLPNAKLVEQEDTALSAKMVSERKNKTWAAVASKKAGEVYGLKVLKRNIQDDNNNYTRFLVVAKDYAKLKEEKNKKFYKTSIIFSGGEASGFLFKALACFSLRDINLSKIESRPMPKSPWKYYFYLDFEGKFDDENIKNAIDNLKEIAPEVKILGSYKASKI